MNGYRFKMAPMSVLGKCIRRIRESQGLTQEDVALKIGILRTNYVAIESRGKIGISMMEKIANALNIPISKLAACKAIDDYGIDTLIEAIRIIEEEEMK